MSISIKKNIKPNFENVEMLCGNVYLSDRECPGAPAINQPGAPVCVCKNFSDFA